MSCHINNHRCGEGECTCFCADCELRGEHDDVDIQQHNSNVPLNLQEVINEINADQIMELENNIEFAKNIDLNIANNSNDVIIDDDANKDVTDNNMINNEELITAESVQSNDVADDNLNKNEKVLSAPSSSLSSLSSNNLNNTTAAKSLTSTTAEILKETNSLEVLNDNSSTTDAVEEGCSSAENFNTST
jgi:hypothetical protein